MSAAAAALPPERDGEAADRALAEIRQRIEGAVSAGIWSTEPAAVPVAAGGVAALRFDPPGAARGTIVHFHGGAYRLGRPEQVGPFAAALARRTGARVLCPRYRLAPEHPFPAALNDGLAVLDAIADPDRPLVLSGDSAGGGLAAALAALRAGRERPPAAGLVLLSAWLDLRACDGCYERNAATDPMFSRAAAAEAARLYLQGAPAAHPAASPLLGAVDGLPPCFVSYGLGEVLAEDSRAFAERVAAAGVPVRTLPVAGMEHVAVTRGMALTGAEETFEAIVQFVDAVLGGGAVRAARRPRFTPPAPPLPRP